MLLYALILVLVSIPVSFFSVEAILQHQTDDSISEQADQFIGHIKGFEYLDDLERDLEVLDQLSSNVHITPSGRQTSSKTYETVLLYDSLAQKEKPFRMLSSGVDIKGNSYLLTITVPLVDQSDLVIAIGLVQVLVSILLVLGLVTLNRSLSQRLWRPFYKTLEYLKSYQPDRSDELPLELSSIQEFDDLNKTVAHLATRNREIFLQQKEFIENAAHELQTPIAIFQSKLDDLMQRPGLTKSEAETIMELESTAMRMGRLNKNLLLLSKIDNNQFADTESIELSEVIMSHVEALKPMAELEELRIRTQTETFLLSANLALIEILVSNLLHNAIRYSPAHGEIVVQLSGGALVITNSGKKLKMGAAEMMQRFRKESADPQSSGLGLSIVKRICDRYHYALSYSFDNGLHVFSVEFKKPK
jgi:signal transduction histidine kinase